LSEAERAEGFSVAFLRYDSEREKRLRDILVAPEPFPSLRTYLGTPGVNIRNNEP
jgi:hypothetical protein